MQKKGNDQSIYPNIISTLFFIRNLYYVTFYFYTLFRRTSTYIYED